ncbi:MAG TPA: S8 family peptidase [Vicinamibacterales bacterium]|jgi:serine protease AprX
MNRLCVPSERRKAVWGPKRTLLAALLFLVGTAPMASAAGHHGRQGKHLKPGWANSFVRRYRMDDEVTRRSGDRNGANTTKVIVSLVPGAQLPPEFKRFARNLNLDIINGVALELPNSVIKKLADHPSVFQLHYDRPIQAHNYRTSVTVGARVVQQSLGYNGAGVGVAIIDSGITAWHDDLTNNSSKVYPYGNQRVSKFVDFIHGRTTPYDDNGHGSHVAGIIAGNGYDSNGEKAGIAPGASLVSLKVLDENGEGTISNIIAALNWVALNGKTYNIRVVNLSVGAAVSESYWTDPLTLAAKAVTDKGITVVAAAGNFGNNRLGQPQWGGITAPGNAPWVLTVGASSTNGTLTRADDVMATYSSAGPTAVDFDAKPDLVAPGTGTVSLAVPGSTFYLTKAAFLLTGKLGLGVKPYIALSGTSMAAPVVSGTVALMLQANPNLTPNLIKAILQYTSQRYPGYSPLRQGAGFLNSYGAVRLARFYATARAGDQMPVQSIWSRQIIWGNHRLKGGYPKPTANAWANNVVWGTAKTLIDSGDNIVWGMACGNQCDNIVWGMSGDMGDNIVWGMSFDAGDNIVWGMAGDAGDNIVWGMDCGGDDCDNVIWGSSDAGDNIVWGMAAEGDNIVWGMAGDIGDNIVWGMSAGDAETWGSDAGDSANEMYPDTADEPLPSLNLEFGDTVPLPAVVTSTISSILGGGL